MEILLCEIDAFNFPGGGGRRSGPEIEVDIRLQKLTELANLSDKYCNRAKTIFIERLNSIHAFLQKKKYSNG